MAVRHFHPLGLFTYNSAKTSSVAFHHSNSIRTKCNHAQLLYYIRNNPIVVPNEEFDMAGLFLASINPFSKSLGCFALTTQEVGQRHLTQ